MTDGLPKNQTTHLATLVPLKTCHNARNCGRAFLQFTAICSNAELSGHHARKTEWVTSNGLVEVFTNWHQFTGDDFCRASDFISAGHPKADRRCSFDRADIDRSVCKFSDVPQRRQPLPCCRLNGPSPPRCPQRRGPSETTRGVCQRHEFVPAAVITRERRKVGRDAADGRSFAPNELQHSPRCADRELRRRQDRNVCDIPKLTQRLMHAASFAVATKFVRLDRFA